MTKPLQFLNIVSMGSRSARRSGRCQRAQALVETALLVPVMVFILGMGVAVGQMVQGAVDLTNASRSAAQVASQDWYNYCSGVTTCGSTSPSSQMTTQEQGDAITAACSEQGYAANLNCLTDGSGTDMSSITVKNELGQASGNPIVLVQIAAKLKPILPLIPTFNITVQAAAEEEQ